MKKFKDWLEENKKADKPKDKKTLTDGKDKKKTVTRPDHHCFGD